MFSQVLIMFLLALTSVVIENDVPSLFVISFTYMIWDIYNVILGAVDYHFR